MRVTNDPAGQGGAAGAFAELFRLESDFQARLAEETLRYLRQLHGAVVPVAPGTVVLPSDGLELRATGARRATAQLMLDVENLQRAHCLVTLQVTPLVSAAGVTWFPASDGAMPSRLLAPGTSERFTLTLSIPAALPAGDYRGAMLLQGFRSNSIAVVVTVEDESSNSVKFVAKAKQKAAHAGATKTAKKAAKKSTTKTTKKATKRAGKKPFGTRRGA
ncbi:MAG: hypothetical protein ACTHM4_14175 [Rhodanobacteraceae bacterium]